MNEKGNGREQKKTNPTFASVTIRVDEGVLRCVKDFLPYLSLNVPITTVEQYLEHLVRLEFAAQVDWMKLKLPDVCDKYNIPLERYI